MQAQVSDSTGVTVLAVAICAAGCGPVLRQHLEPVLALELLDHTTDGSGARWLQCILRLRLLLLLCVPFCICQALYSTWTLVRPEPLTLHLCHESRQLLTCQHSCHQSVNVVCTRAHTGVRLCHLRCGCGTSKVTRSRRCFSSWLTALCALRGSLVGQHEGQHELRLHLCNRHAGAQRRPCAFRAAFLWQPCADGRSP